MRNSADYDNVEDRVCKKIVDMSCGWINGIVMSVPSFVNCLFGFVCLWNDKPIYQNWCMAGLVISLILYIGSIYLKMCAKYLLIVPGEISDYSKDAEVYINKYEVIVKVAKVLPKIIGPKKWLGLDCVDPLKSAAYRVCLADMLLLCQWAIFITILIGTYINYFELLKNV